MLRPQRCFLLMLVVLAACSARPAGDRASAPSGTGSGPSVAEMSVDAGDVTLHVRMVGRPNAADTVITVHGGPGLDLEAMAPFEGLARPGRTVVGYDQRGAGTSTDPTDGDFGLSAQVADLDAVRVATGADRVDLVGESWGGAVAAAYAADHPDHVRSLVLVGAVPLDRAEFRRGQQRFLDHVAELQSAGLIPDPVPGSVGGSCVPTLEAMLPAYVADPSSPPAVEVSSCTSATSTATYSAFIDDGSVEAFGRRLGGFSGGALLVMGEQDAFGTDWVARTTELLHGAMVQEYLVPDAGHLVSVERPNELLARVAAFLDR